MNDNYALTEAVYYILLSLCTPRHGYAIMQQTQKMSDGRVTLAAGTLYGALNNLCTKGWIEAMPILNTERKKEYRITDAGRETLKKEYERLQQLVKNGEEVFGGRDNG